MSVREATAIIHFDATTDAAEKKLAKLRADAAEGVVIPYRIEQRAGPTSGADVATFGNRSGMVSNMPDAGVRLDAMSVARNTGPSLAIQNGHPGAPAGGLSTSEAPPNQAEERLNEGARARDQARADLDTSRFTPRPGGHGSLPILPSRYGDEPDNMMSADRVMSYRAAAEYFGDEPPVPPPAPGNRPTARRQGYRTAEGLMPLSGDPAITLEQIETLLPRADQLPPTQLPAQPSELQALLQRFGTRTLGLHSAGMALQSFNQLVAVGQDPYGSANTLGMRNAQAYYEIGRNLAGSVPLAGPLLSGAFDLGSSIGNFFSGNGFISESTLASRDLRRQENRDAFVRRNLTMPNDARRLRTFNTPDLIRLDADDRYRAEIYDIRMDASLTDSDRANQGVAAGLRRDLAVERGLRDYGVGISSQYANTEVDRRIGNNQLSRNAVGELYESTLGRAYALPSTTDPQERAAAEYSARVRFTAGVRMMARENREATYDIGQGIFASQQESAGESLAASETRINLARQQAIRGIGSTGFGWLDNMLGRTGRVNAVNNDADEQIRRAQLAQQQRLMGAATTAQAAAYALDDKPHTAEIAGIVGSFLAATKGMNPMSTDYGIAQAEMTARAAVANTRFIDQRNDIRISQQYRYQSLSRQFDLDPVGAQASDIAGSTIDEARQLFRSEMSGEASMAKQLGIQQLNVLGKQYGLSFRGEAVDLRSMSLFNPRDAQDPSKVFDEIEQAKKDIRDAKMGGDSKAYDVGLTPEMLKPLLEDLATKIVNGLVPSD